MPDTIEIKLRNADNKIDSLISGQSNKLSVQTKMEATVIEMEDINFHFDSAVLLPDYGTKGPEDNTAEQNRLTGLGVLFSCYKQAEEKDFAQRILVTGHTDKKGGDFYNLTLSQKRAENVFFMFMGERSRWVNSCDDKHQIEDIQQILKWISFNFRYDCDPGDKTNKMNSQTTTALKNFQIRYNKDFVEQEKHKEKFSRTFSRLSEDGKMGKQTWGAFFDMYTLELSIVMGITEDGLNEIRSKLEFVKKTHNHPAPVVGCGENFPASGATTEAANAIDRRVEIIFFDEGEEPELKCHPVKFNCIKSKCDLYPKDKLYTHNRVPATPLPLPSGIAVRVHLKFMYKTPDGNERPFPKGFPYKFRFKDNSVEEFNIAKDDGQVFHQVLRDKKSFIIEFDFKEIHYIASPDDETQKDELIKESAVQDKIKKDHKVFRLPLKWSIKKSVWTLSPSVSNYDDNEKEFNDLENLSVENIGSEAAPIRIILNPNWQNVRLEFFDRQFGHSDHSHKRISIPEVMLEGLVKQSSGSSETLISSASWQIHPDDLEKTCQCLPWIIQFDDNGTALNLPNRNIIIQFKTPVNSYIVSESAQSRKIEQITDTEKLKPSEERLKYYDLPILWRSKKYFCRSLTRDDNFFDNLSDDEIRQSLSESEPLIFSLDDIVITKDDLKQFPLSNDDMVAIFFHQFQNPNIGAGKPISDVGIYNPGNDASKPYYPYSDIQMPVRYYISDYPDWTRMILINGNVYDVFDKRTPAVTGNDVVGARAAVLWFDSVAAVVAPLNEMNSRPSKKDFSSDIKKRFLSIQPFFSQDMHRARGKDLATGVYKEWENPVPSFTGWLTGRFDMILLRCCDIQEGEEFALNLNYFRFFMDYTNAPTDNLDGSAFDNDEYKTKMLANIPRRWNGPDAGNAGLYFIKPKDESKFKFKVKPFYFVQAVPKPRAHFQINVISIDRANMNGSTGEGNFSAGNEEARLDNSFIAAHECGHGGSLPDEYNERWSDNACSYFFNGFGCQFPGDPYSIIPESGAHAPMMFEGTRDIHNRYFWHAAEFVRLATDIPMVVQFKLPPETMNYELRTHDQAPKRTFTYFPLIIESNASISTRGKTDLHIYQLGNDLFRHTIKAGKEFDGLLIVLVKIRYKLSEATRHNHIVSALNSIRSEIDSHFNQRFKFEGTLAGVEFKNCLIHFYPRFLIENLIVELTNPSNVEYLTSIGYTVGPPNTDPPTTTNATQADYTTKVNAVDSAHPKHFEVNIGSTLTSGWSSNIHLNINLNVTTPAVHTLGSRFWAFFGDMVGLDLSTKTAPNNEPTESEIESKIVNRVLPGAKVSKV